MAARGLCLILLGSDILSVSHVRLAVLLSPDEQSPLAGDPQPCLLNRLALRPALRGLPGRLRRAGHMAEATEMAEIGPDMGTQGAFCPVRLLAYFPREGARSSSREWDGERP